MSVIAYSVLAYLVMTVFIYDSILLFQVVVSVVKMAQCSFLGSHHPGSVPCQHLRYLPTLLVCAIFCGLAAAAPQVTPLAFRFTQAAYNASIRENSVGKTYVKPSEKMGMYIQDPELQIRFKIIDGDLKRMFKAEERFIGDFCFLRIRLRTGAHEVINRELQEEYHLVVRGSGRYQSGPRMTTQTEVLVKVLDENDLSPLFYPTHYDKSIPENTPIHASITKVSASDADVGVNGEIYYSFAEPTDVFMIHPTSGIVYLTQSLDYNDRALYDLEILANDRGPDLWGHRRTSRATLKVTVEEVNFYAPDIRLAELPSVIEHGKVGAVYAILHIQDKDVGENGEIHGVEITGGNQEGYFRLRQGKSTEEFVIEVARTLDREIDPYGFNLTIEASDGGIPSKVTTKTIHVKLQDTNDQTPRFPQNDFRVSVNECVPIHTPLIFVNATDIDYAKNGEVSYEITGGNDHGWFRISQQTGLLSVIRPLDAETAAEVVLSVTAQDQANMGSRRASSTQVRVAILDCNDNTPVFNHTGVLEITLDEGQPVGSDVYKVSAWDADSGDNGFISYSIANIEGMPFTIDSFTGMIKVSQILDYESMRRVYYLRVRASDWGSTFRRESELIVKISLRDVNDNKPQFEEENCIGYLSRDAPSGTSLLTVSAIDFDVTNIISYSLENNDDQADCFEVDSTTGVLRTQCSLTQYTTDFVSVKVRATDGVNPSDPLFINGTLVNSRNSHLSTGHVQITCEDSGVSQQLTELLRQARQNNAEVDTDLEPQDTSLFMDNLNSPSFAPSLPSRVTIMEGMSVGSSILTMSAQDPDHGYNHKLLYTIMDGNSKDGFKVDTYSGVLMILSEIDREDLDHYNLNITVMDMGDPPKSASRMLEILVADRNDNPPEFEKQSYTVTILESTQVNTSVIQVTAVDRDTGVNAEIRYSILTDTDDFGINPLTGEITVRQPLDRETQEEYRLRVKATDSAVDDPLSSVITVNIHLEDVNDNAPAFFPPRYHVRVREDLPVGTVVLTMQARDPDTGDGGKVRFSLQQGMDDKFVVDRLTGTIRIASELDYEDKQIYNITARVKDRGAVSLNAKCSVVIEIVDVNENLYPPVFPDFVFQGTVQENEPVNTVVMQLIARDDDSKINPSASPKDYDIVYSIRNGSGLGLFTIDRQGGWC